MRKALKKTNRYQEFSQTKQNRPMNMQKRGKLIESMRKYGFLAAYPLHVQRTPKGSMVVVDGQHRLAAAEKLGLAVYYVEDDTEVSIAEINNTQKTWDFADYAMSFASQGKDDYLEVLEFSKAHGMPVTTSAGILANNTHHSNVRKAFTSGLFKVKSRELAERVAHTYNGVTAINRDLRVTLFLRAIMGVCLLDDFNPERLITNAKRRPEKLIKYGDKGAYLDMIQEIYNDRATKRSKMPLRFLTEQNLADRQIDGTRNGRK